MEKENDMETIKDIKQMHGQMLWCTVRIKTDKASGSGTVIYSGKDKQGVYHTYVLTCHHVVSDNIKVDTKFDSRVGMDIKKETRVPAEVEFFYYEKMSICQGVSGSVKADIVAYDVDADIALLEIRRTVQAVEFVAKLFPKSKEAEVHIFDPVWACGAALGHEPIATHGIINFMNEPMEEGIEYWMSSAQIIFGNSGGSIYRYSSLRKQYEFIGIPARVSISMSGFSPDPVTHMGFFVPITRVYKLIDENFYQFIYDTEKTFEQCAEARDHYKKEREKLLIARFGGTPQQKEDKRKHE